MLARDRGKRFHSWTGNIQRAFEIPPEHAPSLGRPAAYSRAEIKTFGICGNEGFGKHDQTCALRGRLARSAREFFRESLPG